MGVEDLIDYLLDKDVHWTGICAVLRGVRNSSWYDAGVKILQDKKIMPTDREEIIRIKAEFVKKFIDKSKLPSFK